MPKPIFNVFFAMPIWSASWSRFLYVFKVFFQAEDGIRDAQESRGLGDVYKRQLLKHVTQGKARERRDSKQIIVEQAMQKKARVRQRKHG